MDNYIAPGELRAIADACEALKPLWDLLISGPQGGVSFDMENDAPHVMCYDANGETLGFISWGEDGAVFYPSPGETLEATTD